jgi:hypothetical protein
MTEAEGNLGCPLGGPATLAAADIVCTLDHGAAFQFDVVRTIASTAACEGLGQLRPRVYDGGQIGVT